MENESRSLRNAFNEAESKRKELESSWDINSVTFQENLNAAIATYDESLKIVYQISLFSSNETLEDVTSSDLQYFLISFHLAELTLKMTGGDRKAHLQHARLSYDKFLKLLESYDMLSPGDAKLYERYAENPTSFSTASTTDAAARRDTKIATFREEKGLKRKLEHLRQNPTVLANDEDVLRDLHLTNIKFCVLQTFQSLESISMELAILALAPTQPPAGEARPHVDSRDRGRRDQDGYSDRLDGPLIDFRARQSGPILSADGKPMRPFTLLDSRQRLQQGVFRPDHSLPTMTIDEYLEEEKRRGGMIEGGGEQSAMRPEPDEDNLDKADEETLKARAWDEYQEANTKGSGNTMNRG